MSELSGWWLPALPALAAVIGLAVGRSRAAAATVAIAGTGAALAVAIGLAARAPWTDPIVSRLTTIEVGGTPIAVETGVDGLAVSIAVMVGIVALLVQIYSTGYLHDDARYGSYAAIVSLFTAAMLLVVVAGDLVLLLIGWEVMGLCSYLLIGHHWEDTVARSAAVKAFLTTRLGDVGLLLGIVLLGREVGSYRIVDVVEAVPDLSEQTLLAAGLLLAAGVLGKSAQFPLHTWLPDAMAGPTPISALIHAATMVAAGIFLVARLYPVFAATPAVLATLAVLACIGMLGAALAALAQDDIKRVLAYSTISQLAYMLAALGVGDPDAAIIHLLSHAGFKAMLFLGAGCVIHAVATNSMSQMGGLRRAMPATAVAMGIGLAAGAGVPPLAGFFSKDAVLHAAEIAADGEAAAPAWAGQLVLVIALITVAVTAAYSMRLFLRTFAGEYRGSAHPHEAPPIMLVPVWLLVIPTVGFGLLLSATLLPTWISPTLTAETEPESFIEALGPIPLLSVGLALIGGVVMWAAWRRDRAADPATALHVDGPMLRSAFGVDALYGATIVAPVNAMARGTDAVEDAVIDGGVEGLGRGTWAGAGALRSLQNGNIQRALYGVGAAAVAVVLVAVGVG